MGITEQLVAVSNKRRSIVAVVITLVITALALTITQIRAQSRQNALNDATLPDAQANLNAVSPSSPLSQTKTDVSSQNSSSSDKSNVSNTDTTLTVNGQDVNVPDNGTNRQTITSDDDHTVVDVNVQNSSTGNTRTRNSTSVKINSKTVETNNERRSVNQDTRLQR